MYNSIDLQAVSLISPKSCLLSLSHVMGRLCDLADVHSKYIFFFKISNVFVQIIKCISLNPVSSVCPL